MKHAARKAVIKHKATEKKTSLNGLYRDLVNKAHKHTCSDPACRLIYEDNCDNPAVNARCRPCSGERRTWVRGEKTSLDPRPCCIDNTRQVIEPDQLLRFLLAGPGPWFQCITCRRAHGHPCTDPTLIDRCIAVANLEGKS
jgi:hypothetical protein